MIYNHIPIYIKKQLQSQSKLYEMMNNHVTYKNDDIQNLQKTHKSLKYEINKIEDSISELEIERMLNNETRIQTKIIETLKHRYHDRKTQLNIITSRLNDALNCFNPVDYGFDYEQHHMSLIESDYDGKKLKRYKSILDNVINGITVKYDENDDIHVIDVKIRLLCVKINQGLQNDTGLQSNDECDRGVD